MLVSSFARAVILEDGPGRVQSSLWPPPLEIVHLLFLVNLGLQVWDGLASYYGLMWLGVAEGNPLMRALMAEWGVGWALVGAKGMACMCLFFVRSLSPLSPGTWALTLTAGSYVVLSFLPWCTVLFLG
jgi:hypothetical protein